ncbi:beta-ketoacyl-ACP synthase III [Pelotomaculum propionicicum]|uniref:Beta-ketoacyl-[acyl-carrier-protein] synthase III n=1 Tax=Pelotomaculum propionicicum TaxID=258475 RepID=A0A4Y7RTR8_9FIRM|nr:beta-ketoacyl-ACP synthase III [Pelotomaculum propionicicum]TEB12082.1 3-oxoacyl-(acyl-carrier-protein) synthase 3 [Pelotomaculum propionicicum]
MPKELINVGIAGVGAYVPDRVLTNADLEKMVDTTDEWIINRSGIRERRIAPPEMVTSDFAVAAGRQAIAGAGITAEDVDLVIVATNTPDMLFPATACLVQDRIGAKKAGAFDLAAGCTGFMYALVVGSQFVASGSCRNVLVIGAENLSKIINWKDRRTCVLFGDGAGAVVLRQAAPGSGILAQKLWADGSGGEFLTLPAGGARNPATHATVENNMHFVHMRGKEIFKFAVRATGKAAEEVLSLAGLKTADIDFFIPHQANVRIIEAAAKRLGLPKEKVLVNVDRYGNTSTASMPITLYEAVRCGKIKKGNHILMVGFGAGLTWAAAVLKW